MSRERKYRRENVSFGRMLHHRGYVAATDGNLSVRLDEERILAAPTAMSKGALRPADMVIVDPAGRQVAWRHRVSSEISMHLLIYKLRPDVRGIVHAHPRTATGFAAAGIALNQPLVCEVVIGLGSIPLARYGTPGTSELCESLEPLIPQYDAILMSNHGVVTYLPKSRW
jgi:L-fuculose-phosphate aldolase